MTTLEQLTQVAVILVPLGGLFLWIMRGIAKLITLHTSIHRQIVEFRTEVSLLKVDRDTDRRRLRELEEFRTRHEGDHVKENGNGKDKLWG